MTLHPTESSAPVIACNLNAIAPEERAAHEALAERLIASVTAIKETPSGYALRLPLESATLRNIAAWIANERLCCAFLTFTVSVGAECWLELGSSDGSDDVKAFIRANFVSATMQ